jgi:hypothetical protein
MIGKQWLIKQKKCGSNALTQYPRGEQREGSRMRRRKEDKRRMR